MERRTKEIVYRLAPVRKPRTFDWKTLTVRVIATAEVPSKKIRQTGSTLYYYYSIIILDGVVVPPQVPLFDSHQTGSIRNVIGSARSFTRIENRLECTVQFARTKEGMDAAHLVAEGHLTDFSVGILIYNGYEIPPRQSRLVNGQLLTGPITVYTETEIYELSLVFRGANPAAKALSNTEPFLEASSEEAAGWRPVPEKENKNDAGTSSTGASNQRTAAVDSAGPSVSPGVHRTGVSGDLNIPQKPSSARFTDGLLLALLLLLLLLFL